MTYPKRPGHNPWTVPQKREFNRGFVARCEKMSLKKNPWDNSLHRCNYVVFRSSWDEGWKAADQLIKDNPLPRGGKVTRNRTPIKNTTIK